MSGTVEEYDAIVCGAGVAGLAVAHVLGAQGRHVLLVERERQFRDAYKGEVLQPRALGLLATLGLDKVLIDHGAIGAERFTARAPDGRVLADLDYSALPGPYNGTLIHRFRDIQQALSSCLPPSVEFRRGTTAHLAPADGAQRIEGVLLRSPDLDRPTAARAVLTIAADGRGSALRKAAGLDARAVRYDHQFVGFELFDVPKADPRLSAFVTPDGVRLLFPMPGDRARLYVQADMAAFRREDRADPAPWLERLLGAVPALEPIGEALLAAAPSMRMTAIWRLDADTWSRPGLVLIGDAAHCVHPIAAQGMSGGVDDAWTLGEHLAGLERFTPAAVDAALDRFEAARKPRQQFQSRLSHSIAQLLTGTTAPARLVRSGQLRLIDSNDRLRSIMVFNMSGLGVHRFSAVDRLHQLGVPDPRRSRRPRLDLFPSFVPRGV